MSNYGEPFNDGRRVDEQPTTADEMDTTGGMNDIPPEAEELLSLKEKLEKSQTDVVGFRATLDNVVFLADSTIEDEVQSLVEDTKRAIDSGDSREAAQSIDDIFAQLDVSVTRLHEMRHDDEYVR